MHELSKIPLPVGRNFGLACRAQGADGAIGSSYNVALPLWREAGRLYESGDTAAAAEAMIRCCEVVGYLANGYFLTRLKLVLRLQGIDCGLPRSPYRADIEIPESCVREILRLIARYSPRRAGA